MSAELSIESVLSLDVRKATEAAKKFASKPLKLNLIIPTEDVFKKLDSFKIKPVKVEVDRTEIESAIASLETLNNTVKVSSAKIQTSIDTRVNHIVKFDTLKYDSIVAKTVNDTSRELRKELQYLNKNVRQLRPNQLTSLLGLIGKSATAPLRFAGKIGTTGIENIFAGFAESIGRTFYEGFKPEKNIKNFARKIKIAVKRIDQYLIGKEQVVETLLSELLRSGDIQKASTAAFDRTKLKKELDKLEQLKNVALDPTQLTDILAKNPELQAIYSQVESLVTGGKKVKKSQRTEVLRRFLDELRPKKVIDGVVNPLIEEVSPLLRFIQGMQAYRTNVKAQEFYNERKAGFPILSQDIVNVIGGAQFAEGQGGRKVAMGLEAITPDLRFIPVENPDTDKTRVPSPQETVFLDLVKQFAPDLVNNKDLVNTVTNAFKQISFALDPTAFSTAAAQAIANTRLAQEQGRKASTVSYSLGGAEAFRYGQAAEYAGIKDTNTLALAYPFLDLAKNAPANFQSSLLSGDPLNFPYQLGLGGKTPEQQNIFDSSLGGMEAHAYKHLFKQVEFLDLYLKTLDQEMSTIKPKQASSIAGFGANLYELLGAAQQIESLIKTGDFDLKSPYKGFLGESVKGVDLLSKLGEAKYSIEKNSASTSPQLNQLTQELEVYFNKIQQKVVSLFKKFGTNIPNDPKEFSGLLKYSKEIEKINQTLQAFKTGRLPSQPDQNAYFAGGLDPKEVERRLPVLQNETIEWFKKDEAKQFGSYQDKIIKAYQEVERIALEFVKNNGKLSDTTLPSIKQFPVETFPNEVNTLLNKQLDTMRLPSEEQSRALQVDVPEAFKKTQAAILAYNKLLDSLTADVLPEIQKLQKVAYGMSGAAALLSDKLVYKTDLDPAGAQKIASEQEIKAYEKLQGRLSPLLYQAIPGEALVTERTKGRPLKEILDRIAKPYKELQKQREELNNKLSLTEDDAEINKLQQEIKDVSRKAQREKSRFNKAANILYTQVGRLGAALQDMGVVHNDLASGNVFFSQGGPQAIDLGNSEVLPRQGGTTQKVFDQITAQQRALIDRDYYGLLDPLSVIPAIARGYSDPFPIPQARSIDKSLLSPEAKGKEIPLGSYTKTLLTQLVGDIVSSTPKKPGDEIKIPIAIEESEAVAVGKKIGTAASKAIASKVNEKLLINPQGDVTSDKGQITKLSDITPSQAITVAMRDTTNAITVIQKGAIAVNQGFNETVSVLMPLISTLYKLDQGAKGFIKAVDPTGLSGIAIKGAETLLPAAAFGAIAGGTPIAGALSGTLGSVIHPLMGAGGDALATGLSQSIGGSLEVVPLVGNQLSTALSHGLLEASTTLSGALGNIGTEIATNLIGGQALKTFVENSLSPVNQGKLKELPSATQDVVNHAIALGNAMRREADKLLTSSNPEEIKKATQALNAYMDLTYLALQEAKLETKALPGSRESGTLYNQAKSLQRDLTKELNQARAINPEIIDINTQEFAVSKKALDAYEKEALRVSVRVREILSKGGDLRSVPDDIIEGFRVGLRNNEGGLTKTAIALAKILPEEFKRILEIASPSKWAIKTMRFVAQGIGIGSKDIGKELNQIVDEVEKKVNLINVQTRLDRQQARKGSNETSGNINESRNTLVNRIKEGAIARQELLRIKQQEIAIQERFIQLDYQRINASKKGKEFIDQEYVTLKETLRVNKLKTGELRHQLKSGKASQEQLIRLASLEEKLADAVKIGDFARINAVNKQIQGFRNIVNQGNVARDFVQNLRGAINTVAGDFISKLPPPIKKVGGMVKGLGVGIAGYFATSVFNVYDIIFRLQYAIRGILRTTEELEALKIQLAATGGNFDEAIASADKFKTSIRESIKGYSQLTNATRDTVLEGKPTLEILDGINQASRVFGLTTEENNGILLAARQIASDAILQMQDFNQLAERIPGAMNVAARGMGVSLTEFRKLNREGLFSVQEFLPAFAKQLKLETQAVVSKAVQTTQALREELKNQVFLLQAAIGTQFEGQIQTAIKTLTTLAKVAQPLMPALLGVGTALGLIATISLIQKAPAIIGFFQNLGIQAPLVASAISGAQAQMGKFFSSFEINLPRMVAEFKGGLINSLAQLPHLFTQAKFIGMSSFAALKGAIASTAKATLTLASTLGPLLVVGLGIDAIAKLWNENTNATKNAKEQLKEYEEQLTKVLDLSEGRKGQSSVIFNQEQFKDNLSLYTKISDPFVVAGAAIKDTIVNIWNPQFYKDAANNLAKTLTQPLDKSLRETLNQINSYSDQNTRSSRLERGEIVARQKAQQEINKSYLEFNKIRQQIKAGDDVNPEQVAKVIGLLEQRNQVLENAKPITSVERGDIQSEINDIENLLSFFSDYQTALNGLSSSYSAVVLARKESIDQAKNEELLVLQELEQAYLQSNITQDEYELQKAEATKNRIVAEAQAETQALQSLNEKAIASINKALDEQLETAKLENNAPLINKIEEQRKQAIQAILDGSLDNLGQLVDKAIIEEIEKTEEKVTEVNKKATIERLKYAKLEKETKIKKAQETAQTKISLAEQERLITILELEKQGVIDKEEAEKLKGEATLDRIKLELKAESEKLKQIAELYGKDSQEYQQQQQAKNGKIIELLNAEISAQKSLGSTVSNTSNTIDNAIDKSIENRKRELDVIKSQLDLIAQVQDKVKELEDARFTFTQTVSNNETALGELRIQQLQRALEIRRQLTSEEADNLSNEQKRVLQQELASLGVNGRQDEKSILQEIAKIERENGQRKLDLLKKEFEFKERMFALDVQRAELESRQQILEARKAVIEAEGKVEAAQTDKELSLAQQELEIAKNALQIAINNRDVLTEINKLKEKGLKSDKESALATETANQSTKEYETRGEIAEANRDKISILEEQERERIKEAKDKARSDKEAKKNLSQTIQQIKEETQNAINAVKAERSRGNQIITPIVNPNPITIPVSNAPIYRPPVTDFIKNNSENLLNYETINNQLKELIRTVQGINKPSITNNISVPNEDNSRYLRDVKYAVMDGIVRGLAY